MAAGATRGHSADILRKAAIVALLIGAMVLVHRFGVPTGDFDPTGMLALGFVILASYTFGQLVEAVKLPYITGYIVAGLLLGPAAAQLAGNWLDLGPFSEGVLNRDVIGQLRLLDALALALIALTAGGELKIDQLRSDAGAISSILVFQMLAILLLIPLFIWSLSGPIPWIAIPEFTALSGAAVLVVGAMVASVAIATSPSVTIAVINGAGAKGPMTRIILSTVVVKDVADVILFSLIGAVAGTVLGATAIEGGVVPYIAVHVGGSLVAGVIIGIGISLYLRYVGAEILLFLVGVIYAASFVSDQIGLAPILVFLAAGFTTSNFSRAGDLLIHEVERLSMPVYVVFFTLAGASLHLDVLQSVGVVAAGIVLIRIFAFRTAVGFGARFSSASESTQKYGWMGFVSQAGVSITLASIIGRTYGELGQVLETILIAGVAMNELIGPVLLKTGLGLAGELPEERTEEEEELPPEPTAEVETRLAPWTAPPHVPDPWGPPPDTSAPRINAALRDLELELQGLVRDLLQGPLEDFRGSGSGYLRALRREFLRHHRRLLVRAQAEEEGLPLPTLLRSEQSELAEHWRTLVLDRATVVAQEPWSPARLVEALDRLAEGLPEVVHAPYEPESLRVDRDDSPWTAVQRAWLRTRWRTARMVGQDLSPREVHLRALGRYWLSGVAPTKLEGLAALLVRAEEHLAARTRSLFDGIVHAYDGAALAAEEGPADEQTDRLWRIRREVEDEFALAVDEVDRIVQEAATRTALVLGEQLQQLKREVRVMDTLDLPARRRRYSRVFGDRSAALKLLGPNLGGAIRTTAARYSVLGLELELVGLEGRIKEAVEVHGSRMARHVRGRGATQLARVDAALAQTLEQLEHHLDQARSGEQLAAAIRADADPLARVCAEAYRSAADLLDELAEEASITPLLDALLRAAQDLTERYVVPTGRALSGDWKLPAAIHTVDVPFREVAMAYIETNVTRDLVALNRDLSSRVERLTGALGELERIVAFNVELAVAELDVLHQEAVPPETRDLVRDMVIGALRRSRARISNLIAEAEPWTDEVRRSIRAAVLDDLEALRGQVVDGKVSDLRVRLMREAAAGRRLVRDAGELTGLLARLRQRVTVTVHDTLGEERIDRLRQRLGIPEHRPVQGPTPDDFLPPKPNENLPPVYRRLFSDQALEAGDLLTGRQVEIEAARRGLTAGRGARLRAVAIIGQDGVGKGAVVSALLRSLDVRHVRQLNPRAPVEVKEVDAWFRTAEQGDLYILDGLQWLFRMEPDGFDALRRFVDGVVADRGRNAWLVSSEHSVWRFASRAAPLREAFPEVIPLKPLDSDELAAAILARHAMSGYGLRFDARDDLAWQTRHLLIRGEDRQEIRQKAWFRMLHGATGGVVHDALRLWMASIQTLDEDSGIIQVGPVPHPPLAALRALPDGVLLTLRQVTRQGWISPALHASLFRADPSTSRAHLARLGHWGLLVRTDDVYRIADHLRAPIDRVLTERGWME